MRRVTHARIALGDRSLFPDLTAKAYLAFAAAAPLSSLVKAAVNRVLDSYAERGNIAFLDWVEQRERLRQKLATLIGAQAQDIALVSGTTRGLSDLALCMPWQRGDRVVLFDGEFPANVNPWQRAGELFGLELEFVSLEGAATDAGSFLEPLERLLQRGARLVAVSAVQFQTGLRMPLRELGRLCSRYGAELCVDAIQACGIVPIDVEAEGIDYLVTGAHKWLLGPEGAGFVYARPARAKRLVPRSAGWLSHEDATRFLFDGKGQLRYDRPLKQTIQVLEGGSTNSLGFAALEAGIEPLLKLTPTTIFAHVSSYLDTLEAGLVERGFQSLRSADPAGRSGILAVEPVAGRSAPELVQKLRECGVSASMPDGLLRFAPHFPNPLSEIETVLDAVDQVLAAPAR